MLSIVIDYNYYDIVSLRKKAMWNEQGLYRASVLQGSIAEPLFKYTSLGQDSLLSPKNPTPNNEGNINIM